MAFTNRIAKAGPAPWVVLLAVAGMVWFGWRSWTDESAPAAINSNANQSAGDENRAAYASLYDMLWRQDDGRDTLLVTATLFTPELRTRLGADGGRSDTEEQLWRRLDDLTDRQAAAVLTFDQIGAALSDQAIEAALSLTVDDATSRSSDWQGLIATPRVVNAPTGTSSQIGVAVFTFDQPLDWADVKTVRLRVAGLGQRATRDFSWSAPALTEIIITE